MADRRAQCTGFSSEDHVLVALEGEFEFRKHALSTDQVVGSSAVLETAAAAAAG